MLEEKSNRVRVFARGFAGVLFQDAQFNAEHVAEMSQATYKRLVEDFPGADVQILDMEEEPEAAGGNINNG